MPDGSLRHGRIRHSFTGPRIRRAKALLVFTAFLVNDAREQWEWHATVAKRYSLFPTCRSKARRSFIGRGGRATNR